MFAVIWWRALIDEMRLEGNKGCHFGPVRKLHIFLTTHKLPRRLQCFILVMPEEEHLELKENYCERSLQTCSSA